MGMKRSVLTVMLSALLCLLLLAGCGSEDIPDATVTINGVVYKAETIWLDMSGTQNPELDQIVLLTDLERLDVRDTGIGVEDYEFLREALPECEIQWSVPFQDGFVDSSAETIAVTRLEEGDIARLDYLEKLTRIEAEGCEDYDQLLELRQHRPECQVAYTMKIGGESYALDASMLTLESLSAAELELWLPHLPNLESIELTGIQNNVPELLDIMEAHPEITLSFDMDLLGFTVNSLAAEIDISGAAVENLEELEAIVTRLPNVTKVVMCDCGISNEEMDALNRRHENIQFVWSVTILHVTLRTDITYLMPHQYNLWPNTEQAQDYKYFTELICLDLGHHNLDDCSFVAYMPHLKYLLLGDTQVHDITPLEGLEELIYLELFMTDVRDYTPLLSLKNLECLNITYTYGRADIIAQLTWVDYIRWITSEEGMLYPEEQRMLKECLTDTLLELGVGQSSTGGMWRHTQQYFDQRDILGMYYMEG